MYLWIAVARVTGWHNADDGDDDDCDLQLDFYLITAKVRMLVVEKMKFQPSYCTCTTYFCVRIIFQKIDIVTGKRWGEKYTKKWFKNDRRSQLLMCAMFLMAMQNDSWKKNESWKNFTVEHCICRHSMNAMQWCRSTWTNLKIIHKSVN